MTCESRSEKAVVVPVGSGEEDLLLGDTLRQLAGLLACAYDEDASLMIVRSEYGEAGLVKTVIFQDEAPAARFRDLWAQARARLNGPN